MTDNEELEYLEQTFNSWPDWKKAYVNMILGKEEGEE